MQDDDRIVGRLLGRREVVALFGASAAAAIGYRLTGPLLAQGARAGAGCVVVPQQAEGPYFVDTQLERADIRSDPSTGIVSPGARLDLRLAVQAVTAAGACLPLAGATVDVWQCDAMGVYSDARDRRFETVGQKFLRGYQVSGADGMVRFTTIYPGWYPGRAVHIHVKVRTPASAGPASEFTSQFYFDESMTDRVHAQAPYAERAGQRTRNERDGIFRNGGAQLVLPVQADGRAYAAAFTVAMRPGETPPGRGRGRGA